MFSFLVLLISVYANITINRNYISTNKTLNLSKSNLASYKEFRAVIFIFCKIDIVGKLEIEDDGPGPALKVRLPALEAWPPLLLTIHITNIQLNQCLMFSTKKYQYA